MELAIAIIIAFAILVITLSRYERKTGQQTIEDFIKRLKE